MNGKQIEAKLLKMVEKLLTFPFPQICRHSVALDLLELLEEIGEGSIDPDLVKAVTRCRDDDALEILRDK